MHHIIYISPMTEAYLIVINMKTIQLLTIRGTIFFFFKEYLFSVRYKGYVTLLNLLLLLRRELYFKSTKLTYLLSFILEIIEVDSTNSNLKVDYLMFRYISIICLYICEYWRNVSIFSHRNGSRFHILCTLIEDIGLIAIDI